MNLRHYIVVTLAYWSLTITDGGLRMLVLLHFHQLGYSPVTLGLLFLLYEFFGVVTNLIGGWLGSRYGLNRTLYAGLGLQVIALTTLSFQNPAWAEVVSVIYVMGAQALAGIAKDLTKMSSKSAIRLIVEEPAEGETAGGRSPLFTWVAALTGSKNALKGVGFFVGGGLLAAIGFRAALLSMSLVLASVLVAVWLLLTVDIGRASSPPPLGRILSKSSAINRLSVARLFLFGGRDVWFVVALPLFLADELDWSFGGIGAFLAFWVIGYGVVQSVAPRLINPRTSPVRPAAAWAAGLALVSAAVAALLGTTLDASAVVVVGVVVFGIVFAVNSSLHSYLILAYTNAERVAGDVGFYYSANAAGRLLGTLLSGLVYLNGGLQAAMWTTGAFMAVTSLVSLSLPPLQGPSPTAPEPAIEPDPSFKVDSERPYS